VIDGEIILGNAPEFQKKWHLCARLMGPSWRVDETYVNSPGVSPGRPITIRSSKYLNNLIEQDHRAIKSRVGPMLGFKEFVSAQITLAGVELLHRIGQGQFALRKVGVGEKTALEIWNAVLAA
jgi:transposase-like protein